MSYFPVEDFVGNGALKGILPKLLEEGWDNARNLKLMKSEDMDAINMTQQQKDALEMRSYLHDRALMQYGDKLEDSRKSLAKLHELSNDDLSAQFGMKRGHIASFLEKKICCYPLQATHSLPSTQKTTTSPRYNYIINNASKINPMLYREAMGGKEKMGGEKKPELVPQISSSSQLFSWINWSSKRDTKSSKEKMEGKENEDNDDDVLHLMQYINDQQQLERQFTSNENTVIHVAAQFGNQKYVKIILEKGPSSSLLRCLNIDGETPLHIAVRKGHLDIVKALIECAKKLDHEEVESGGGATKEMLRATNKDKDTALHMAVRNPYNTGVVEWLTKEDPEFTHPPNNAKETPLYLAAERHDMVSMILKNCTSPAYGGPKGQTALHAAVASKWTIESTKLLLEWKPDLIKETDEYGCIPLHYAALYDNKNIVKLMLEKDTSVAYITTGKESDEKTALHIAVAHGNVDIMEEPLLCCPDCWEMVNSKGQNVLHIAVDMEQEEVIEYILKKPWIIYLINQKDIEGNTPLHLVDPIFRGDVGRLWDRLWFTRSGDLKARNNKNETPKDIYQEELNILAGSGGINIVSPDQELSRKKWKEERKKREAQYKESNKALNEEMKKMGDTHMVVATLIATITFAAGFTMPGGYNSNEGSNQGMPLLLREAAFKVFVITNTIAVICSTSSVFLYVTASLYYVRDKDDSGKPEKRYSTALLLILIAVAAMIVAFITGSFAMFAHSLGLAISVCLIGCITFLIYFIEIIFYFQNFSKPVM